MAAARYRMISPIAKSRYGRNNGRNGASRMQRPVILPRGQTVFVELQAMRCSGTSARGSAGAVASELLRPRVAEIWARFQRRPPWDQRPGALVNVKKHGLRQKLGERDPAGKF
jgi:hypothetical protein